MLLKFLVDEDFINYKLPCMFIGFPTCSWKCEKECGKRGICQNTPLASQPVFNLTYADIVKRYMDNPITKSIVFGGLEPLDSLADMINLIDEFRKNTDDPIVIYTGYNLDEICRVTYYLGNNYKNIIFKVGRFIPDSESKFDEVLGVTLASSNQYGIEVS